MTSDRAQLDATTAELRERVSLAAALLLLNGNDELARMADAPPSDASFRSALARLGIDAPTPDHRDIDDLKDELAAVLAKPPRVPEGNNTAVAPPVDGVAHAPLLRHRQPAAASPGEPPSDGAAAPSAAASREVKTRSWVLARSGQFDRTPPEGWGQGVPLSEAERKAVEGTRRAAALDPASWGGPTELWLGVATGMRRGPLVAECRRLWEAASEGRVAVFVAGRRLSADEVRVCRLGFDHEGLGALFDVSSGGLRKPGALQFDRDDILRMCGHSPGPTHASGIDATADAAVGNARQGAENSACSAGGGPDQHSSSAVDGLASLPREGDAAIKRAKQAWRELHAASPGKAVKKKESIGGVAKDAAVSWVSAGQAYDEVADELGIRRKQGRPPKQSPASASE